MAHHEGRVVFCQGALPGDLVAAEVVEDRGRFLRATTVEVLEPSLHRVPAPCPHAGSCGGCSWQEAAIDAQRSWKQEVVSSQLAHLGGLRQAPLRPLLAPGPPLGYRNRMDFRVFQGRPALLEAGSHRPVPLSVCLLLIPSLAELFHKLGDLTGLERLTLRGGLHSGERLVLVEGEIPPQAERWGVSVAAGSAGRLHEEVAGVRFRISGTAFFQANTLGAEALVALAEEALAGVSGTLVDLYAGGGLFALTVGSRFDAVTAVESERQAVADLRHNVRRHAPRRARVLAEPVERALGRLHPPVGAVVADPPRAGMGRQVVKAIARLQPQVVVSVSCDPASFARDARLLVDEGYQLDWVQPVDLFPMTWHVETVARFRAVDRP